MLVASTLPSPIAGSVARSARSEASASSGRPASSRAYASRCDTPALSPPSSCRIVLASSSSRPRESCSPRMACSSASGLSVDATAAGLAATSARNASHRAIASSTGVGPERGDHRAPADEREPLPVAARALARRRPPRPTPRRPRPHVPPSRRAARAAAPRGTGRSRRLRDQHGERVADHARRLGPPDAGLEPHQLALDLRARQQSRLRCARRSRRRARASRRPCGRPRTAPRRAPAAARRAPRRRPPAARPRARAAARPAAGSPRRSVASAAAASRSAAAHASACTRSPDSPSSARYRYASARWWPTVSSAALGRDSIQRASRSCSSARRCLGRLR